MLFCMCETWQFPLIYFYSDLSMGQQITIYVHCHFKHQNIKPQFIVHSFTVERIISRKLPFTACSSTRNQDLTNKIYYSFPVDAKIRPSASNDTKNCWRTSYGHIYNSNRFMVNFSPWCLSLKNSYGLLSLKIEFSRL